MKRFIEARDVKVRMGFSSKRYHGTLVLQVSCHDKKCELETRNIIKKNIPTLKVVLVMVPKVMVWALNELGPNEREIEEDDIDLRFVYNDDQGGSYSMRLACEEFSCEVNLRKKREVYEEAIAASMIPDAVEWISEKFGIGGMEANSIRV